ncbi:MULTISPECIES: hypothetical protein [unclassified Mesorhizobium]|uniref:hypothetical protein n=1 Tax=unclassified Mesorhizobium TaxID=325217 RepID=UPI00112EF601|nr:MULTISPECIES: hypothetical protein [unclassified Mesorhizobium]MBZ9701693.1 hypothetical protein [Mesorhizobium sp. CO1-1-3]MBZ9949041.1 hypothetical protein [Mesorhizobium sp. BR1-1-11]TPI99740.1 hypothetical protein FJ428_22810 [Mesorhizobium sp. B2-8-1]
MSEKSAAELEREAEIARAAVVDTAESIRSKMTPGQLIDEFTGLFAGGAGTAALSRFQTQVSDNPLALMLVGTGLAWLMLGSGASAGGSPATQAVNNQADTDGGTFGVSDVTGAAEGPSSGQEIPNGGPSAVAEMLSDAGGTAGSIASNASEAAATAAGETKDKVVNTVGQLGSSASDMAVQASRTAQELFEREPLALAVLGLAAGTAIGVLLPRTTMEDEQLGGYRDKLLGSANSALEDSVEQAKEIAAEAYETVKSEADRQGSSGTADTLAGKVGEVVKATAKSTEKAVRDRLPESDQSSTAKP